MDTCVVLFLEESGRYYCRNLLLHTGVKHFINVSIKYSCRRAVSMRFMTKKLSARNIHVVIFLH
jgi:hypothetical protein